MENYIGKIALLDAQIEALGDALSKGFSNETIKSISSYMQNIPKLSENYDTSLLGELHALLKEHKVHENIKSISKQQESIVKFFNSKYFMELQEKFNVFDKLDISSISKNIAFVDNKKGTSIPTEIPEYKVNPNIQYEQRPSVVEIRLEGNDLVCRL
ncbi:hypothetical protein [Chryseobacterium sp. 2R14A]|uniref:hypothetical protein n=1 Tax=Chryseobacterium sp. 2R14A TaxID=3380353 RepID=UPI003CF6BA4E